MRVSSIGPPHARHTFALARAEGSSVQFAMPQSVPLAASSKLSGSSRNSYPLIEGRRSGFGGSVDKSAAIRPNSSDGCGP
jgi:hypothetical protein